VASNAWVQAGARDLMPCISTRDYVWRPAYQRCRTLPRDMWQEPLLFASRIWTSCMWCRAAWQPSEGSPDCTVTGLVSLSHVRSVAKGLPVGVSAASAANCFYLELGGTTVVFQVRLMDTVPAPPHAPLSP
jgi:hypothetical protein